MVLRWAYKKTREFARRMVFYRGEYAPKHPTFVEGSDASCRDLASSVEVSAPDIVYTAEDDKAIDEYHRNIGEGPAFITCCPIDTCIKSCYNLAFGNRISCGF
jgi:hypothetical protein